jgi:hypothetical protein
VGGPVQHDPCQVAFHSPAGRLPARLIPARRRRPAPCARRQQTMVLPRPSRGLVRHAPTVASQAPSDPSTTAPTHARWFSAPETIARCLSVDQGLQNTHPRTGGDLRVPLADRARQWPDTCSKREQNAKPWQNYHPTHRQRTTQSRCSPSGCAAVDGANPTSASATYTPSRHRLDEGWGRQTTRL